MNDDPMRNSFNHLLCNDVYLFKRYSLYLSFFVLMTFILAAIPAVTLADDYVGGLPLTTVQTGTVSGGLWFDASPAPDWGSQNVTKSFTLPAAAVAEPGRITWARLYVSAYCIHMQDNRAFTITNSFDGNGDGVYDEVWPETGRAPFYYQVPQDDGIIGNDNMAFGGGLHDPYKIINDHETRVTSDYFMYYDVTGLIHGQTVGVNVNTKGSADGRIKVITLVVAYNDGDDDQIQYWVNQGHDVCSYYVESQFNKVAVGNTTFNTAGILPVTSATLTVDYMASNNGDYGFPTTDNSFSVDPDTGIPSGTFTGVDLDRTADIQGPYSGVKSWNVTSYVTGSSDVTLSYARYLPGTGTAAFYKIPLAFLVVTHPAKPVAEFTANVTSGLAPLSAHFTDDSTGEITSRAWDFNGDGTTDSMEKDPDFTFDTPGDYTVKLHVNGPGGASDQTLAVHVLVPPAPVAGFTSNVTSGIVPFEVGFTDRSTNRPVSRTWDFGDGNVSHEANSSHIYTVPGHYAVSLAVSNAGGNDVASISDYVYAKPQPPVAKFTANTTIGITPLAVQFTDLSTNQPGSWRWDFGDGNTSDEPEPSHVYYASGSYTVSLTAENAGGSNTTIAKDFIVATDRPVFYLSPSAAATPVDGELTFNVMAEALPNGLREYNFTVSTALPEIAGIDAAAYPEWATVNNTVLADDTVRAGAEDPGDSVKAGASEIILATITLTGYEPGVASIELSDAGMIDDFGNSYAPVVAGGRANVYVPLYANITASVQNGETPLPVSFTGNATGTPGPSSWSWDFGDDHTSGGQNATHTYDIPGNYTARLTVANDYDSYTATASINVTAPRPKANFTYNVTAGPAPLTVKFTDRSSGSPTSWSWDFGDGNTFEHPRSVSYLFGPERAEPAILGEPDGYERRGQRYESRQQSYQGKLSIARR